MILGAGVLFITPQGKVLLLKRAFGGDHGGEWCFPGGTMEAGETAIQTAEREVAEEIGVLPDGDRHLWTRRVAVSAPDMPEGAPPREVDFTTFVQRVDEEFIPALNEEHTAWCWSSIMEPPEPLHPGCRVALGRFSMDELGIARAIAAGDLTSPQRYENVWLFDLRITGTGASYRSSDEEFCWRPPADYLSDEFLERCNGLAVLWVHPKTEILNSEEYGERNIGSIMLPYIKGDEVWGVAKIYDADAVEHMRTKQLSTSSGVRGVGGKRITLENGSTVLIEEKPRLLDHVAIVPNGVWDKLGAPTGVSTTLHGEENMPVTNVVDAQQAAGDQPPAWASKILTSLDDVGGKVSSLANRMDSFEAERAKDDAKKDADEAAMMDRGAKKDALQAKCDSGAASEEEKKELAEMKGEKADAKKDAEEEKAKKDAEEKAKSELEAAEKAGKKEDAGERKALEDLKDDSAKKDGQIAELTKTTEELRRQMVALTAATAPVSEDVTSQLAEFQAKCDSVMQLWGDRAPQAMRGETPLAFRKRLVKPLIKHSDAWNAVGYEGITVMPEKAFEVAERQIYADAQAAASRPSAVPVGELMARTKKSGGHEITEYFGSPSAWMGDIAGRQRLGARSFNTSLGN